MNVNNVLEEVSVMKVQLQQLALLDTTVHMGQPQIMQALAQPELILQQLVLYLKDNALLLDSENTLLLVRQLQLIAQQEHTMTLVILLRSV